MQSELRQFLKQDKAVHSYSIVNISSIAGTSGYRLNAPYAASKHAVIGITKSTALEYARSGVRVNAVCPAFTLTPMITRAFDADGPEVAKLAERVPLKRVGKPEESAAAILWLLSDASSFTTGHSLMVDGGISAL